MSGDGGDARAMAQQVWGIFVGKTVVDAVGKRVGKVARVTPAALIVRCGYLFHTEEAIAREEIDRYEAGRLVLRRRRR